MVKSTSLAVTLALLTASAPALADEAEEDAPGASKPHMQDGWQFSGALGGGYLRDDFEQTLVFFADVNGVAEGASGAGHFAVGYAVKPGLNLGGLVSFDQVADPTITIEGVDVSSTDDISVGTLVLIGPYIDWYFTAGEGWHLMGALGGATIRIRDETGAVREDDNPAGGGGFAAIGYNVWVGDEWSIGGLARFGGATLHGDNLTHNVVTSALLFAVTYQ